MHENTIGLKTAVFAPLSLSPSVSISLALYIQYLSLSAMTCQMFSETHAGSVGFLHVLFFSLFFHSQLSKCPKTQGKPKKQKKTILWEESWVSPCKIVFFFCFFLFFSRIFYSPKPNCPKTRRKPKKPKKPKKPILWEESWVSPFRIGFFGLFGFSRGFCCPKPNCPKIRGNRIIYVERHKAFFTQPIIQLSI